MESSGRFATAFGWRSHTPRGVVLGVALAAMAASGVAHALAVGDTVLASPLSLEDRFEVCTIETDLTAQGAWAVRCPSGSWVVGVRWVKPAPPGSVVAAPAAPAPPAVPLVPGPAQRAIPAGVYLAPVGGSLEVLQILGGRVALNPRGLLQPEAFTPDNAADVGALNVAGDQLTITWLDGRERTGRYRFDGKCLSWGYLYCRVEPFERGRYRIDGWLLELQPDDGAARAVLAFPYELYGPADPIYIDGGFLRRP